MRKPSNHQIKTVIFDFDGTLADSVNEFIKVGEELLGIETPLTKKEIQELRELGPRQIMKKFNVKAWQVPKLLVEGRRRLATRVDNIDLYPGIADLLKTLKHDGYQIFVLSTNSETVIRQVLRRHGLMKLITDTYSGVSLAGKAVHIKRLMKKHKLSPEECVYVGDELRDLQAARKAKVHCISVSWGYQSGKVIQKKNPEALIDRPSQFITTVRSL